MKKPAIAIHGGFFTEHETHQDVKKAKQEALISIIRQGWTYLHSHSALQTVVYTSTLLENESLFNAGTGSQIQSDGKTRMSASVCDGRSSKFAGVINIEDVQNPILIANRLLAEEDRILAAEGALQFARANGFPFYNPQTEHRLKEYKQKLHTLVSTGTIGCVAIDLEGNLAAATSTGGKGFELVGRVSDSATVAGNYANTHCAVSCTGVGEDIVNGALAAKIVTRVTDGMNLENAVALTLSEIKPWDGFAGVIALDSNGTICHLDTHPSMVFATKNNQGESVFT